MPQATVRTPDVVEFAVSPQVGQAVLAFARSYSNSGLIQCGRAGGTACEALAIERPRQKMRGEIRRSDRETGCGAGRKAARNLARRACGDFVAQARNTLPNGRGSETLANTRALQSRAHPCGIRCLNSFGILVKNRLLARAAQNGVSMFVSVYRAGPRGHPARERSFRDVPPETV
jgi:hypothetical protein